MVEDQVVTEVQIPRDHWVEIHRGQVTQETVVQVDHYQEHWVEIPHVHLDQTIHGVGILVGHCPEACVCLGDWVAVVVVPHCSGGVVNIVHGLVRGWDGRHSRPDIPLG